MNHFPDRLNVFREWRRVLRPGRHAVFTDPVVITGPVTNDELALRSSIGLFLFVPCGVNEQLIASAGLHLLQQQDVSANAALIAERWHDARQKYRKDLLQIEGALPGSSNSLQRSIGSPAKNNYRESYIWSKSPLDDHSTSYLVECSYTQ